MRRSATHVMKASTSVFFSKTPRHRVYIKLLSVEHVEDALSLLLCISSTDLLSSHLRFKPLLPTNIAWL